MILLQTSLVFIVSSFPCEFPDCSYFSLLQLATTTARKQTMENEEKPEKEKRPHVVVRNTADYQRMKLEKLMKNPEKPVLIPERPKERGSPHVPDFVRNVMGSSAGAGSGEFHVYRHLRRKEYARQKYMQEKASKEKEDDEYRQKLEENKRFAEERTAKKRAKRLKKNKKQKNAKKLKPNEESASEKSEKSCSDEDSESPNSEQIYNSIRVADTSDKEEEGNAKETKTTDASVNTEINDKEMVEELLNNQKNEKPKSVNEECKNSENK